MSPKLGTSLSPPGSALARFLKHFWYFRVIGIYIVVGDVLKNVFATVPSINVGKLEKRTNQVAVITGGTRGIGLDIVKKLLQLDYTVILGVRDIQAAEKSLQEIRKLHNIATGHVTCFNLDLKSLISVRNFASQVLESKQGHRIDLLLNHAGIMNAPFELTEDNLESQFQVNYLSHFLLTQLLLPRIKETASRKTHGSCQIVNTSSLAQCQGSLNFEELETSKVYSPMKSYFDSKLCQVVHSSTLERQFQQEGIKNIHAYSVHPGEVVTDLWQHLGPIVLASRPISRLLCRSTDIAANVILYPVLERHFYESREGGQYFENCQVTQPNPQALRKEVQDRLWERSMHLISKKN